MTKEKAQCLVGTLKAIGYESAEIIGDNEAVTCRSSAGTIGFICQSGESLWFAVNDLKGYVSDHGDETWWTTYVSPEKVPQSHPYESDTDAIAAIFW